MKKGLACACIFLAFAVGAQAVSGEPERSDGAKECDPANCSASCRQGKADACRSIARRELANTPPHYQTVISRLKRACKLGLHLACAEAAMFLHSPKGKQKYTEALALNKQACAARVSIGCSQLGLMYRRGDGVPQDDEKAASYFREGCDLLDPFGCNELALSYGLGEGVPLNNARGRELLEKSCMLTDRGSYLLPEGPGNYAGFACETLGEIFEKGLAVGKDLARAQEFYQRSCDLSWAAGCERLKAIEPQP